jgi:pectate lyase
MRCISTTSALTVLSAALLLGCALDDDGSTYDEDGEVTAVEVTAVTQATTSNVVADKDTFVQAASPNATGGAATLLEVDKTPDEHTYLRFTVPTLDGAVTRARLRFYVSNGSTGRLRAFRSTDVNWSESGMTWNTRPAPGAEITSVSSVPAGAVLELDVTSAVSGAGKVSFVLVGDSTDGISIYSREHSDTARRPVLVVETGSGGDGTAPPPSNDVNGWASVSGSGVSTTTGGGNATPVVVTSASAFQTAASGTTARVIEVSGTITGDFKIGSNKTIYGRSGAKLKGSLVIEGQTNVIMRDLRIEGWNCADTTSCGDGRDAITVRGSHHLWFHHLDISDGSDGNLDMVKGSDFITVSYCKFHYSANRAPNTGDPHRFSNLLGSSNSDTIDAGKLRVTFHHNWWGNGVKARSPYVRFGKVHLYNNLFTFTGNDSAVQVGYEAKVILQNNAFYGTKDPTKLTDTASSGTSVRHSGNLFVSTTGKHPIDSGTTFTPGYAFTLDAASTVRTNVEAKAGPRW